MEIQRAPRALTRRFPYAAAKLVELAIMRAVRLALAVVLGLATALPAYAQFGGLGRLGGLFGGGKNRSRQDAGESAQAQSEVTRLSADDRIRLALSHAHTELKLRPEQENLWQAYEKGVLALLENKAPEPSRASAPVDRLKQRSASLGARSSSFQDLAGAATQLYAALTDEQKQIADRLLADTVPPEFPVSAPARPSRPRGEAANP